MFPVVARRAAWSPAAPKPKDSQNAGDRPDGGLQAGTAENSAVNLNLNLNLPAS
ncbi:hypothetical protein IWX85_003647 [Polaromonas sp. CG_9.11]|nr:hypothetical protein [Polaromonas sp. CG_9.11]